MKTKLFAKVLVDVPGLSPLDYLVPEDLFTAVGDLVVVPLGTRRVVGVVCSLVGAADFNETRIKSIQTVLNRMSPFSAEWMELTKFAAAYYLRSWGEAALTPIPHLLRCLPTPLREKRIAKIREEIQKNHRESNDFDAEPELNQEQKLAVQSVIAAGQGFQTWLLFGVTGSGKTEVYLHLIKAVLGGSCDSQVLLLVPEINLTPQLVDRVRKRFPQEKVVALNSEYSDTERTSAWLSAHEGYARILVGTRMAVFASFKKLSLILVDEEHDASYKAGDGLRYSARDLAVWRGSKLKCPVILGSATPSLESWHKTQIGRYKLLKLTQRASRYAQLPDVELVEPPPRGVSRMISEAAQKAMEEHFKDGRQVLVFLNRRGYSPVLSCPACGWVSRCIHCSSFTVYHKRENALICHHCGYRQPVPNACPSCGNVDILPKGAGTERIEEELKILFPERKILRIDRDSAQKKHSAEEAFQKVHRGEIDILVGTQMVAKGHDFQNIGLVIVLNPDAQILSPATRARERLFATLMQVSGRAGRVGSKGTVLIQTRLKEDSMFEALSEQNYEMFAQDTLSERKQNSCVPFVFQALLTAQADELDKAIGFLLQAQSSASLISTEEIFVYDPVPMALMRLNNIERAQLLIESVDRMKLHSFLTAWCQAIKQIKRPSTLTYGIEVDPMEC